MYEYLHINESRPIDLDSIKIILNGLPVSSNMYDIILEGETYSDLFSGLFTQNNINLFGTLFSSGNEIENKGIKILFNLNKITLNKNDIIYVDYNVEKIKRSIDEVIKDPKYLYIEDNIESINEEDIIIIYNGRTLPENYYTIYFQEEYIKIELNPYKLPLKKTDIVHIDYNIDTRKELV